MRADDKFADAHAYALLDGSKRRLLKKKKGKDRFFFAISQVVGGQTKHDGFVVDLHFKLLKPQKLFTRVTHPAARRSVLVEHTISVLD